MIKLLIIAALMLAAWLLCSYIPDRVQNAYAGMLEKLEALEAMEEQEAENDEKM